MVPLLFIVLQKMSSDFLDIVQTVLCAIAEVSSKRFVNGVGGRPGIMGINCATALWLHKYV